MPIVLGEFGPTGEFYVHFSKVPTGGVLYRIILGTVNLDDCMRRGSESVTMI